MASVRCPEPRYQLMGGSAKRPSQGLAEPRGMFGRLSIILGIAAALVGCTNATESVEPEPAAPAARDEPPAAPAAEPAAPPAPAPSLPAAPSPELPPAPSVPALPQGPYEFGTGISSGTFEHSRLDAEPQVTVRWTNYDDLVHSVVSTDGRFPGSGPIAPGNDFTATFLLPGEYPFHCRFHGAMIGKLVVA